jgi:uncharacterized glyoxalase superfamily protein PhnB
MAKKSKRSAKKPAKKKAKVNPIPAGMRTITPHLVIKGASQALEFYKKAFGAKELEKSPLPDGKLMHASIKIGDSVVMMADEFPGSSMKAPDSAGSTTVAIHVYSKNVDKLWQQALDAGAKVSMPLDNQFWGERYGQLQDPFGHLWSMSQRVKMSPTEMKEKEQQAMAMFSQGEHPSKTETPQISAP